MGETAKEESKSNETCSEKNGQRHPKGKDAAAKTTGATPAKGKKAAAAKGSSKQTAKDWDQVT